MKKSEKRFILILIIVGIVIITILFNIRKGKQKQRIENQSVEENATVEEFVEVLEDGTKLNVSDKLSEIKTFGNYEVSNIQLTENNGQSFILADVKNIGDTKLEVVLIDIILLDKDGNEITTTNGIIGDIEPGATTQLNASATTDFVNAYDFSIKIKE